MVQELAEYKEQIDTMASTIQEGDRVRVVDRPVTAADTKNNLFYPHFVNLTGTVSKIYSTQEAAIDIELDSMPEGVSRRHMDFQENWKNRWLDGLSEEGRNRLSPQERDFKLRYTILVSVEDLTTDDLPAKSESTPSRPTEHDLSAAEEAELHRRRQA